MESSPCVAPSAAVGDAWGHAEEAPTSCKLSAADVLWNFGAGRCCLRDMTAGTIIVDV